jgi:hypothetical protein
MVMQHGGYVCFPGDLQKVGITSFNFYFLHASELKEYTPDPDPAAF